MWPNILHSSAVPEKAIEDIKLCSLGETPQIVSYVTDFKPVSMFAPLYENMTSSTKQEVWNILHCCQRMTELQPQVTSTESFVNFVHVVFEIGKQTDTYMPIAILCAPLEGKVIN